MSNFARINLFLGSIRYGVFALIVGAGIICGARIALGEGVIPTALQYYRDVHPRLFVDAEKVKALRSEISTTHKVLWSSFIKDADTLANETPTVYQDNNHKGEQLWQRKVGNTISTLAFAYLITHDKKYLDAASAWATVSCNYPTWGWDIRNNGLPAKEGLNYGHQLLGLAMLYDYSFDDLAPETKALIRKTMIERTRTEYSLFGTDAPDVGKHFWPLLQNHTWIKSTGMLAVGLVLFDEEDETAEAAKWITLPEQVLAQSTKMLSPDGASEEGFGYWQYGNEYLLKLMDLSRITGESPPDSTWWKNATDYCLSMMLPRNAWTADDDQNDYADGVRYTWYGPDYILRNLACRNHDGVAQWLADQIDQAHIEARVNGFNSPDTRVQLSPWLNLLWYDPSIKLTPPTEKPTLRYFPNMGIVVARSDWSGDESIVFFKSGNPLGIYAPDNFSDNIDVRDICHVHRDANHFTIFGNGEWLIRNSTYAIRETKLHNTLTVGGKGQRGDEAKGDATPTAWPLKSNQDFAHVVEAESTPAIDRITGDATHAYPASAGLKKFVRHLLFLKPNILIVADEIETTTPQKLDLYFHPESPLVAQSDGSYLAIGKTAALRIIQLTQDAQTQSTVISQELNNAHYPPGTARQALVLEKTASTWRNAVAFSWSAANAQPVTVTADEQGAIWTFKADDRSVSLDWNKPALPSAPAPVTAATDQLSP